MLQRSIRHGIYHDVVIVPDLHKRIQLVAAVQIVVQFILRVPGPVIIKLPNLCVRLVGSVVHPSPLFVDVVTQVKYGIHVVSVRQCLVTVEIPFGVIVAIHKG